MKYLFFSFLILSQNAFSDSYPRCGLKCKQYRIDAQYSVPVGVVSKILVSRIESGSITNPVDACKYIRSLSVDLDRINESTKSRVSHLWSIAKKDKTDYVKDDVVNSIVLQIINISNEESNWHMQCVRDRAYKYFIPIRLSRKINTL